MEMFMAHPRARSGEVVLYACHRRAKDAGKEGGNTGKA